MFLKVLPISRSICFTCFLANILRNLNLSGPPPNFQFFPGPPSFLGPKFLGPPQKRGCYHEKAPPRSPPLKTHGGKVLYRITLVRG